jgi:tripartite-type tricarboxylate transporter receptor subunit TctC
MQSSAKLMKRMAAPALAGLVAAGLAAPVAADEIADFYKGKVLTIWSGMTPGGSYTAYAQVLKDHMGKYIPGNPTIIVGSRTGGSGRVLANWMYNVGPRDGSMFGLIHERMGLEPHVYPKGTKFDGRKLTWIGSMAKQKSVCFTWKDAKTKTFEDAQKRETIVGTSSTASTGAVMPRMLNSMAGTKFKIISGYDPAEVFLAMERGELDGLCGYGWSSLKIARPDFIADKKVNLILQFSDRSHKELEGKVPVMMDYITNPKDRQMLRVVFGTQEMGRPFVGPPEMPKARLAALRKAFLDTMKDPAFLADAKKRRLEIDPISGEEIEKLVNELYETPKDLAQLTAGYRKPAKVGESKRKIVWKTVSVELAKTKGRYVYFMVGGEEHRAKLHGRRTKVTIAGKEEKTKALKAGLMCDVTYPGHHGLAKQIACK